MKARAIDANIILRFLLADHPQQSPRCRELFARVEAGTERISVPEVALSDVVWTLKSFYRWTNEQIRAFVITLLLLDGVEMPRKTMMQTAITLFADHNIDFSDALIAAEILTADQSEIYSYDHDFHTVAGIERIEP